MSKVLDDTIADFIVSTIGMIVRLIRADGDRTLQEEALMDHAESVKRQLDRTKFVDRSLTELDTPVPSSGDPPPTTPA
jgi:hypothetical protein